MGKKEATADAVRALIGDTHKSSTDAVQAQYNGSTDAVPTTHKSSTEKMQRYDVRFTPTDWAELERLANTEGSSRGVIIRRAVRQYLRGR